MKLVGRTFTGTPAREALEIIGAANPIIRRCEFRNGKTLLRVIDCTNVMIDACTFTNPLGPPDPDGQAIQFIRSTGTILNCVAAASVETEDLISIYGDAAVVGSVLISGCILSGRGKSNSGTSICIDGPTPPTVTIEGCKIAGARCGITIAGGSGHVIRNDNVFRKCETKIYVHRFYEGGTFGNLSLPFKVAGYV